MIKAIIFDFDSTLVDYHYSDQSAIKNVLSILPNAIDYYGFLNKSGEFIMEAFDIGLIKGEEIQKYRLEKTLNFFGYDYREIYLKKYYSVYMNEVKVYEYVEDILRFLTSSKRLGILTNLPDVTEQNNRITKSGLKEYFEVIGISGAIGYSKPDKRAFDWIAGSLNVNNDECIFIGDSEKYDICGAKNAGMYAIKKVENEVTATAADYFFKNYIHLKAILKDNNFI